jgi:hypothetical protein
MTRIYDTVNALMLLTPAGLRGSPRRLDPRKHNAGGFIVRVLRHQLTSECFGKNGLVEMVD